MRVVLLGILVRIVIALVVLKLVVWWLEPRMAFFPLAGVQDKPAAAGIVYRDLRIGTADGETLHAWWLEHGAARAQVVFFHGNGGNLSLWLDLLVEMWRRGLSVLAVDYRGYGASTGSPSERGLYRDAEATVRAFEEGRPLTNEVRLAEVTPPSSGARGDTRGPAATR